MQVIRTGQQFFMLALHLLQPVKIIIVLQHSNAVVNWKIDSKNTEIDCQEEHFNFKYIKKHSLRRPLVTRCYISCLFCLQFGHANFQIHFLKEKCMLNQIITTDAGVTQICRYLCCKVFMSQSGVVWFRLIAQRSQFNSHYITHVLWK